MGYLIISRCFSVKPDYLLLTRIYSILKSIVILIIKHLTEEDRIPHIKF